jgi:hypothetical protein
MNACPPATRASRAATRPATARPSSGLIDRGRADGTTTRDVASHDIVVFGSMLAQPRPPDPAWDATCGRLLATYLAGLGSGTPDN